MSDPVWIDLLASLGISRHEASLAQQHILCAADLRLLSLSDCVELGMTIGERNRVVAWSGTGAAVGALHDDRSDRSAPVLKQLARCVADLEQNVCVAHHQRFSTSPDTWRVVAPAVCRF